jgi:hypothetical protein
MSEKSPLKATLTAKGLRNISRTETEPDFEFIVGDRRYGCPWFVAEFLSPKVSSLRSTDRTLKELRIETADKDKVFGDFVLLGGGWDVVVTEANSSFFVSICRELWNEELYSKVVAHFEEDLTISNVFDRLLSRESFCGRGFWFLPEIDFLASHFHELSKSVLNSLSVDQVHAILSNSCLRIRSEDELYGFIVSRLCEDFCFSSLLEFVRFEFVSVSSIEHFISSDIDSFTLLNRSVWTQICRRLILSVSPCSVNDRLAKSLGRMFRFSGSSSFEGIISHLTSQHGGNVHDRGIVHISGLHPYDTNSVYAPKNVADLTATDTYFCSRNEPNQMLIYDFQRLRITSTHYSVRSRHDAGVNCNHPKSWVIEVSDDGSDWFEIDRRENNNELNGRSLIHTFSVSTSKECRMIRLRQIGPTHYGEHYLQFSALEIFGSLHEP